MDEWDNIDSNLLTKVGDHGFALKVKNIGFNEELRASILEERDQIVLVRINGHASEFDRDRYLGVVLLYNGSPLVHNYTFYVALCYSDPNDVRRKEPRVVYNDELVRLFRAGVGRFDYFFAFRNRMPLHDEIGKSDGSAYKKILDIWKL